MRKGFWLGILAGLATVILVVALGVLFISPVQTALASAVGPSVFGMTNLNGWGPGNGFTLPPELQRLSSIPADQRFAHFLGVQVNLKDENNNPLTINVVPGKVTASSATSLTITANSGGDRTFTITDKTIIHGKPVGSATGTPQATPSATSVIQTGDDVVVVTLNNSTTATAVIVGGPNGFTFPGHHRGWGPHNKVH